MPSYLRKLFLAFLHMGLPNVITTDQGKEFRNQFNDALMDELGIKHRLTSPYHPQANGLDERFNQTLVNALAKHVQDDRTLWDVSITRIVYSYNTSVHDSTRCSPFEVMFGRQGRLPVDINRSADEEEGLDLDEEEGLDLDEEEGLDHLKARRADLNEQVKQNVAKAQVGI